MVKETSMNPSIISIGVSSCLLGKRVRFDGGHKKDSYIVDALGAYFRFVPVCPEIEVGMPVPRESVRLEGESTSPRMVGNKTGVDWTERMSRYSRQRVRRPDLAELSGFIFKNRSPSCGMERVKLYVKPGTVEKKAVGLFARTLMEHYPNIPVEEEGRLADPSLRENFIIRVFAYHRLQQLLRNRFSRGEMVTFHTVHKYLLLAHSPNHYQQLGRLVAGIKSTPATEFKTRYESLFMDGLSCKSTARKNTNVLQHILGFLRPHLSVEERQDIVSAIEDYHRGLTPLIVPITLISHFVRKHDIEYIRNQVYLNPHPKELMLRNHV
jgi:uncharacterized protein YbgA (DUF1722 family)/uncharacterized protein YbbK (DUF523 family)